MIDGAVAKLGARAFDVLIALVERREHTISKNELLDIVWPGLIVEENNLQVHVSTLRRLLGAQSIVTIPGRGYRFTAPIETLETLETPEKARHRRRATDREAPSPALAEPVPDLPVATASRGNLPAQGTALFGRDDDAHAVVTLLQAHPLVTLLGAGGIGKTQLALEVARAFLNDDKHVAVNAPAFRDGLWLVELAPVTESAMVCAAVVQSLGLTVPGRGDPATEIAAALGERQLLIVLDNCEHLLDAVGALALAIVENARQVRLVCTSQEVLHVASERVVRVAPLAVPVGDTLAEVAQSSAGALFVNRVFASQPAFPLDEIHAAAIAEICRRLDGLPLAIELAAARVLSLGVFGVRDRLNERFRLLTGGARTAPRRQQTLRETLDWSFALLNDGERWVLRRASVFVGSFSLNVAEQALCSDQFDPWAVLDHLGALVDKSLVFADAMDPPRYRLLESTRAYALEKLREAGETDAALARHAAAMLALFESAYDQGWAESQDERRARYLPDIDNLRAALDWANEHDSELHVALAGATAWIWISTWQIREGLARTERALAQVSAQTSADNEARILMEWTTLAHPRVGEREQTAIERAVALFRSMQNRRRLYRALRRQAIIAALSGRFAESERACDEMTSVFDPTWPEHSRWFMLSASLIFLHHSEQHAAAVPIGVEALAIARRSNDYALVRNTLDLVAQNALARGDFAAAIGHGRDLITSIEQSQFRAALGLAFSHLSVALLQTNELDAALDYARKSLPLCIADGMLWTRLDAFALLAFRRGRLPDAARISGRAAIMDQRRTTRRDANSQRARDEVMSALQQVLSAAELTRCLSEGANLSEEEAAHLAVAE